MPQYWGMPVTLGTTSEGMLLGREPKGRPYLVRMYLWNETRVCAREAAALSPPLLAFGRELGIFQNGQIKDLTRWLNVCFSNDSTWIPAEPRLGNLNLKAKARLSNYLTFIHISLKILVPLHSFSFHTFAPLHLCVFGPLYLFTTALHLTLHLTPSNVVFNVNTLGLHPYFPKYIGPAPSYIGGVCHPIILGPCHMCASSSGVVFNHPC